MPDSWQVKLDVRALVPATPILTVGSKTHTVSEQQEVAKHLLLKNSMVKVFG